MARSNQIGFKIDSEIWEAIKKLAEEDERKTNDYARIVIMREVKKEVAK